MKRSWIVAAVLLFSAGLLVIVVAIGGGSTHPIGPISVESATPPDATIRLLDSDSCHANFPGWRGSGESDSIDEVVAWFDAEWGPVVQPWTERSNSVGAAGDWRHYSDLSIWLSSDGRFVVQTFETVDHSCPQADHDPWGGIPESAWSQSFDVCPNTTDVWFAGLRYGEKTNALGSVVDPTLRPPVGWDTIEFGNGARVSYLEGTGDELVVRLPGTPVYQAYSLGGCALG